MKDRRFGVELEFDSAGIGRSGVINALSEAFDRHGLRRWYFGDRLDYDGSEFELRTPVLRGDEGFHKLKVAMDALSNAGCYCTTSDGMHVHHDAPDYASNIDNCIRLVKSWKRNKHLIYQFVSDERFEGDYYGNHDRNVHWACPEWSDGQLAEMEKTRRIPGWERNDVNLSSLPYHGTVEFRLHEGTLNFREAKSWIDFGRDFLNRVAAQGMYDSGNPEKLLKKVEINPEAERVLLDKSKYSRFHVREETNELDLRIW